MSYQGPFQKKECKTCKHAERSYRVLYCNHPVYFGNAPALSAPKVLENCKKKGM